MFNQVSQAIFFRRESNFRSTGRAAPVQLFTNDVANKRTQVEGCRQTNVGGIVAKAKRLKLVKSLTDGYHVLGGGRILRGEDVKGDSVNAFNNVAYLVVLRHAGVNALAQCKDILNIRGVRFTRQLRAFGEFLLCCLSANCRGTKYLKNLLLESVPVWKIRVVVPEPSFRNIGQVKWDAAQLLWIVSPVQIADEVVVLDPVFDIIASETGKHRWITQASVVGRSGWRWLQ